MNTSKVIHQAKLNSWAESIREQQASSLSVVEWCKQKHLSTTQFYYWRRQLADQFVESQLPDIVPLSTPITECCTTFESCTTDATLSKLSSLTISIGEMSIVVTEDTSDFLLAKVIKAVRNA